MGLLDMRKRKIAENAMEYMEPGEEIRELAMAQTQPSPIFGSLKSKVAVVIATDRNIYVMGIHDWKPTAVLGVSAHWPIAEIAVEVIDDEIAFGKGPGSEGGTLSILLGAKKDAEALAEFARPLSQI